MTENRRFRYGSNAVHRDQVKPCTECDGYMYAVKGIPIIGYVPSPTGKRMWACSRCRHVEES